MAENSDPSNEAAMKLGVFLAVIGALAGYNAQKTGGGALAGAVAGFFLGVAIVRFIKYVLILIPAAIGLSIAYYAIQRNWTKMTENGKVEQTSTVSNVRAVKFVSTCHRPVDVYVRWNDAIEGWKVNGPWTFSPNANEFFSFRDEGEGSKYMISASPEIYFHAVIPGTDFKWTGERNETFNGLDLPMQQQQMTGDTSYELSINCDNIPT